MRLVLDRRSRAHVFRLMILFYNANYIQNRISQGVPKAPAGHRHLVDRIGMLRPLLRTASVAEAARRNPLTVAPSLPLLKAAKMMSKFRVGALLVAERGNALDVGMATVQDMLMQAEITNAEEMAVGDLISREVCFIPQQWDLERCAEAKLGAGVHCAPTLGMGGRVDAVISMGDICRAVFDADTELKSEYRSLASIAHVVNRPGMNGAVPIIAPDASVRDAVLRMREQEASCVLVPTAAAPCDARVSNGEGATFRYFSAHEFMQALALGEASWSLPVADLAASPSVWGVSQDPLIDVLVLLMRKGQSYLPVANPRPRVLSVREILAFALDTEVSGGASRGGDDIDDVDEVVLSASS